MARMKKRGEDKVNVMVVVVVVDCEKDDVEQ